MKSDMVSLTAPPGQTEGDLVQSLQRHVRLALGQCNGRQHPVEGLLAVGVRLRTAQVEGPRARVGARHVPPLLP